MHLGGAVSPAGVSWGSARRLWLFVNGRSVHDRLLFRAVMEAYRTYLLRGRYPAAALFLHVDAGRLDVNVHPQKLEVRFAEPDAVIAFVVEAIREALRGEASPLGRWGLGESTQRAAAQRRAGVQAEYAAHARTGERTRAAELHGHAPSETSSAGHARLDALHALVREDGGASYALPGYEPASAAAVAALAPGADAAAEEQHALFDATATRRDDLEIVGQVFAGYVVCQRPGEMLLIDQHAAHERVLFERLMKSFRERAVERQGLVAPITASVGAEGVEAVARLKDALGAAGWDLEPFGEEDVIVRAVPAICADRDLAALVERVVREMIGTSAALAAERVVEQVMATVACHSAVRVGKRLDARGARALLDEIRSVDFASTCPHGRPVARILERARVEHLFGR
jgi:DNA mismatch repair protein MutL